MAIIDDMRTDSAPIDFEHRGQRYHVDYRPLAIDDAVKVKLDDMVQAFTNKDTGDFSGINPLLLDILSDWDFDRIRRDDAGRPLASDGSILTDRAAQAPALERLPITEETIARMPVFLKLDMVTAIVRDINGSTGNGNGTSDSMRPAGASPGATDVPVNGATTHGQSSLVALPTSSNSAPPALVTVPSLESQRSTV